jgi:hypothetical protein
MADHCRKIPTVPSDCWCGVDVSFECPFCRNASEGKLTLIADRPDDYDSIKRQSQSRHFFAHPAEKNPKAELASAFDFVREHSTN